MDSNLVLDKLILKNKGYLFTSEAVANGISNQTVVDYTLKNKLERVARGVYITEDTWEDYLYILQAKNRKIVYSHESALMLNNLAEREYDANVTVPQGYNASHLRRKNVIVHTVNPEYYDIGITQTETVFGNSVSVYNRERTICDIIRYKNKLDIQTYSYAIREYFYSSSKNLVLLSEYARIFGVDRTIRTYTEVMLY